MPPGPAPAAAVAAVAEVADDVFARAYIVRGARAVAEEDEDDDAASYDVFVAYREARRLVPEEEAPA
jgi:hypothetical protein